MTYWDLASRDMNFYKTWDEVPENLKTTIRPEMFPPTPEEAEKMNIKKCLRILPHQQDTGGFFVAVLEKISLLPWEKEINDKITERKNFVKGSLDSNVTPETPNPHPKKQKRKHFGFKEDPFVFLQDDDMEIFEEIKKMYELSDGELI